MFATFDDRGRLFVAESSGLDLYAEISAGTRKCRIRLLEDEDGDGRFESSHVFTEDMVFPMGLAWRGGRLYVADPPDLVALEDTDGDGRADRRHTILTGFGHTDNGSLHGLNFGPDGLLYMTMGMPDGYRLGTADGKWIEGKSGALIRCRPDGSRPEVVCRGFVNLVEVAFLPGGDAIGTDNWFQQPAGGLRDALVHLVEGGLYPYVRDQGTPQPVTGDPLPPLSRFPAVAFSGLVRYQGTSFPAEYRGNLFSAQHNSRSVGRHVLVPQGSTFRSVDADFLTTEDSDFHPSDVLLDSDGSLLIVDTGAWYVQHCPTGRIRASQSQGGLYRVRWAGAAKRQDPWGRQVNWQALTAGGLVAYLSDPRPAVCERARLALAARGVKAIDLLAGVVQSTAASSTKTAAVWALAAIDDDAVLSPLRQALADADADVVCAAARALARRGDRGAAPDLEQRLTTATPRIRLAAAEALAHCGDNGSLSRIWKALSEDPDRFLEHALIHAAHRLASAEELEAALARPEPRVQGAALLLLDQPPRPAGRLRPEWVVRRAAATDSGLRKAALHVLRQHPDWAGAALDYLRNELQAAHLPDERREALSEVVLAFQTQTAVQDMLARAAVSSQAPPDRRAWILATMARSSLAKLPISWVEILASSSRDAHPGIRRQALRTAAMLQAPELDAPLRALVDQPGEPPELRLEALRATLPRHPQPSSSGFELLVGQLRVADNPLARLEAAELAGRSRLDDAQRLRLLQAVRGDALLSPDLLRRAFTPPLGRTVTAAWADYLEASLRGGWRPSADGLRQMLDTMPSLTTARRNALLQIQQAGLQSRLTRLAEFEPLLSGGDPVRGRAVFGSPKVACSTCHRVGNVGGQVGPDLTRIGAIRSGQDLLESILFPSSTFAQGYEPYTMATTSGQVLSGLIAHQDADLVTLRGSSGSETRLRRDEIEEIRRSERSVMPEGLDRTMSRDELRDLLAFLKAQR
jgi:putative heme-binding domain-containing protein